MEKTIKVLLFTWFENVDNHVNPEGPPLRVERLSWLGQTVDINDDASLQRGEEYDAFFTDDEAAAIEAGTFKGPQAEAVYRRRTGTRPSQVDEQRQLPAGGLDFGSASAEDIGEYIKENRLTVSETNDLLPDDADTEAIEKLYDAESYASDNSPRKGVQDYVDARLAAVTS